MGERTSIEWTDATWNPFTGCTPVSAGCHNCYAKTLSERFRGVAGHYFEQGFDVVLRPERLNEPLKWRKPRRVFVNSMSDVFHEQVPDEYVAKVWAVMAATPQHTYQILTKRHGRMRSLLNNADWRSSVYLRESLTGRAEERDLPPWPLPNVWLGVSVENQTAADLRVRHLLQTPAAVRWLSVEPLLGPVDLTKIHAGAWVRLNALTGAFTDPYGEPLDEPMPAHRGVDWVVVGGETGQRARPMHPNHARAVRDQCVHADVPFFFKQHGDHIALPVVDDPTFAGGRAFDNPRGGRSSATISERGGAFRPGVTRPMRAGDRNGLGVMLDDDTIAVRVGSRAAGDRLDGRTWQQYPAVCQ